MRMTLLTDAWKPQVNGVVRTWSHVIEASREMGHDFDVIHPGLFRNYKAPRYPEIRMAIRPYRKVCQLIEAYQPDAIHIATEGPIGQAGPGPAREPGPSRLGDGFAPAIGCRWAYGR